MQAAKYLETTDGAKIYYEDHGAGPAILLVHGWLCSSSFWQKNVPELASNFRVVTLDLRGHGNSSKILSGHTVTQYARDLRQVIEHLDLRDALLVGWSLAGSVVLAYQQLYAHDSRLSALALVDSSPFPFSPGDWNSHVLKDYNFDRLHTTFAAYTADPQKFVADFTVRMFKQHPSDADLIWCAAEMRKTPPWIGQSIYSHFVMSDLAGTLPGLKLPLLVCGADSGVFPNGIAMGKALAAMAPKGNFVPFRDAGHILFYEQPRKFNLALTAFFEAR